MRKVAIQKILEPIGRDRNWMNFCRRQGAFQFSLETPERGPIMIGRRHALEIYLVARLQSAGLTGREAGRKAREIADKIEAEGVYFEDYITVDPSGDVGLRKDRTETVDGLFVNAGEAAAGYAGAAPQAFKTADCVFLIDATEIVRRVNEIFEESGKEAEAGE